MRFHPSIPWTIRRDLATAKAVATGQPLRHSDFLTPDEISAMNAYHDQEVERRPERVQRSEPSPISIAELAAHINETDRAERV